MPMRPGRLMLTVIAATALAAVPTVTLAHAELTGSSPADGDRLTLPPDEVVLTFDGELDPEGSEFVVVGPDGRTVGSGSVALGVADRNELRGSVEAGPHGSYIVSWTARSVDGHAESGELSFTLANPGAPDTAMTARHEWPALAIIGGLLVLLAGIVAARRLLLR